MILLVRVVLLQKYRIGTRYRNKELLCRKNSSECAPARSRCYIKRSRTIKKVRDLYLLFLSYNFFSHPDYTVGFGISPNQLLSAGRGLYRRWGISPPPRRTIFICSITEYHIFICYAIIFYPCKFPLAEMSIGMSCCHSAAKLRHLADSHKLVILSL